MFVTIVSFIISYYLFKKIDKLLSSYKVQRVKLKIRRYISEKAFKYAEKKYKNNELDDSFWGDDNKMD